MALDELFVPHMPRLYHAAARVLRHPQDSEDALQDGLLAAFLHLHQFQGRSKLSTWLHRIVINAALMKLRCRNQELTIASTDQQFGDEDSGLAISYPDQRQTPEERYADIEHSRILLEGIRGLPPRYGAVLQLCDIDGLMEKEAAKRLGTPVHVVKSRRFRGRRMLLRRLRCKSLWKLGAQRNRVTAHSSDDRSVFPSGDLTSTASVAPAASTPK